MQAMWFIFLSAINSHHPLPEPRGSHQETLTRRCVSSMPAQVTLLCTPRHSLLASYAARSRTVTITITTGTSTNLHPGDFYFPPFVRSGEGRATRQERGLKSNDRPNENDLT